MGLLATTAVLLLLWTTHLLQRSSLMARRLQRESWAALGFCVVASGTTLLVAFHAQMPSFARLLSWWVWIP